MRVSIAPNTKTPIRKDSLSTHSKVYGAYLEKRYMAHYKSDFVAQTIKTYKISYSSMKSYFEARYSLGYINGQKFVNISKRYMDYYNNIRPTPVRYMYKSPYMNISASSIEKFYMYSIPYSSYGKNIPVLKEYSIGYNIYPGSSTSKRRTYHSRYIYSFTKRVEFRFSAPYTNKLPKSGGVLLFSMPYTHILSSYIMESITKTHDDDGMVIVKPNKTTPEYSISGDKSSVSISLPTRIGDIITSDGFRLFINMAPLFFNYCINVPDIDIPVIDKSGIEVFRDVDNKVRINIGDILIPERLRGFDTEHILSMIPAINISIYDYYDNEINSVKIEDGVIYVKHNTNDSFSNFGNLEYRMKDIRDDSIIYNKDINVEMSGRMMEVRISDRGQCCFDKDIGINNSSYTCRLPKAIVKHGLTLRKAVSSTEDDGSGGGGDDDDLEDLPEIEWDYECVDCGLPPPVQHYIGMEEVNTIKVKESLWGDKITPSSEQIFTDINGDRYVQILEIPLDVAHSCNHKYTIGRDVVRYMYNPMIYDFTVSVSEYTESDNKRDEELLMDNMDYNIEIDIPVLDKFVIEKMFKNIGKYVAKKEDYSNYEPY